MHIISKPMNMICTNQSFYTKGSMKVTHDAPKRVATDASELERMIREDELYDAEAIGRMTPIDYAKSRNIRAQRVYKAIRHKKLNDSRCQCGRRIIDVAEADALFKLTREPS